MTKDRVSVLSSSELEDITRGALRLRKNWSSATPRPTKSFQLDAASSPLHQRPRILSLLPVPGWDNRYLFSLTLVDQGARRREYSIDCWDLKAPNRSSIANFRCKDLFSTCMNADSRHPHVFCITRKIRPEFQYVTLLLLRVPRTDNLTSRHLHCRDEDVVTDGPLVTTSLNLDLAEATPTFKECVSFHSFTHSLLLQGSTFLATDSSHHVRVFNTEVGMLQYVLLTPLIHDDPTTTLDVRPPRL